MIAARPTALETPARRVFGSHAVRASAIRLSWGMADQAVSSLTNFVVGIWVARTLGLVEFGIFSLVWVTYSVVQNIARGLATDPFVVRFSGVPTALWRDAATRASGTALSVGCAAGLVSVLGGIAVGGTIGSAFIALGIVLPALMLQEGWRYVFFAAGVGQKAFVNDLIWAAALVPAVLLAAQDGTVFGFVLAWGLACVPAAVYGCAQVGALPCMSSTRAWLHEQRDLGYRYLAENVAGSGSGQIRMYGLGAIAGLADVGAVRGSQLLLGPFFLVLMGLGVAAVPEATRVLRGNPHRLERFCMVLGGLQAVAALGWGILLLLLPDAAGTFVLKEVWPSAAALIVPITLTAASAGLSTGGAAGIRALGASRRSLSAQLFGTATHIAGGVGGAVINGAASSSWGVAGAAMVSTAYWWWQLRAGVRDHIATTHGDVERG